MSKSNYKRNGKGAKFSSSGRNTNSNNIGKGKECGAARKGTRGRSDVIIDKPYNMDACTTNDISWYNKYPDQFKTVTQVPTWWKVYGQDTYQGKTINNDLAYVPTSLPVGMEIRFVPGPGTCETQTDGVNRAFATMMADLYAKSSSSSLPFQQADLAMLTFSIDSIAMMIAYAKRALGFANNWVTTNSYYPIRVLNLMHIDYADIRANRANYITHLNASIARFNTLRFPDKFDVIHRHYALCHSIYADEDSTFGQLYVFVPDIYYDYSDTESKALAHSFIDGNFSFSVLLDRIDRCLDALFNSSDLYLINGALQRAYSDGSFTSISAVNDSEIVTPVVDRTMLGQIMNMTIVPSGVYRAPITQDPTTNTIVWQPVVNLSQLSDEKCAIIRSLVGCDHMLYAYDANVTADDNMEFTRLKCNFTFNSAGNVSIDCGTEYVTSVSIPTDNTNIGTVTIDSNYLLDITANSNKKDHYIYALSPFRYIPNINILLGAQINGKDAKDRSIQYLVMSHLGDVYNYTSLANQDLARLTQVAMFSIWA